MIKSQYNVIGVMSGTSLDGIDIAHVTFYKASEWQFKINHAITVAYSDDWNLILKDLVTLDVDEIQNIDISYTEYLATILNDYINSIPELTVDFISSHGHTALHQPAKQITYQIGNLPILSKLLGRTVVCDFRVQDVKLGGQGAPLVPIGDRLLFPEYDACINLGGFANTSFERNGNRIAFDICPVNIVLNYYAEQLGKSFDDEGQIARKGKTNTKLLNQLNDHSYYRAEPPKSLGLEWVKEHVFPVLDQSGSSIQDILCTYVEHISIQISETIANGSKVIITGGGAFNTYLLECLSKLKSVNYIVPSNSVVNYKEALIFGLLGVLKLRGEINCLSSVTGARHDHSSGVIYYP
ncbi:anhydro-N-acetylmuramic acid kinase [Psychroserpens sp.]|uniref:anhydro-N-acetylmuramic acid kinase n=1 Tax=Psychroserpens sp. TaxID=2020870 RepID=UPI001B169EE2|nr:anhydro-N-acetylmuramic acid kinase [Psychroserpens sp.]MBO6606843.1 anhydro-N-acetylmuramic acid kinase [Psychroserpens sp.]MBO6632051.1 anhydro-N-acetylmuramic acid kinase [Psychroserpens sp.]MBO6653989.1 anhydro-N-acetylmuramic acid kinase [Psychroserpens sp.]MBO6682725.1 anhydro-N-acetylmuramic acid kinase [Psychroserpens sp.]MBO6750615.1 anhydro-N-acetylmuramic acid kinase [Psychroserpens sp.]